VNYKMRGNGEFYQCEKDTGLFADGGRVRVV